MTLDGASDLGPRADSQGMERAATTEPNASTVMCDEDTIGVWRDGNLVGGGIDEDRDAVEIGAQFVRGFVQPEMGA